MSDEVPNLRPRGYRHAAGTDHCEEGHCRHVDLMWVDAKRLEKLIWIVLVAIVGLYLKEGFVVSRRQRDTEMPIVHPAELMGADHVAKPPPVQGAE